MALSLPMASRAGAFPSRLTSPPPALGSNREAIGGPAPAAQLRSGDGPYSGEEFRLAHQYLIDHVPLPPAAPPEATRDVIVLGAGCSGLMAAWMLRDLDVLVLEKDRLPGGTAKTETWSGIPYAIGAAYVGVPERGTALARFYRELGIDRAWRVFGDRDMGIFRRSELEVAYWERPERRRVAQAFTSMLEQRYTDLPFTPNEAWTQEEMRAIDEKTWTQLLADGLPVRRGRPPVKVPKDQQEFCALFAPAVLAAKPGECSAWAMLNQFLAEFGPLAALPGGNGFIVEKLMEWLRGRVRTGAMAVSIENAGDVVNVTAVGSDGRTHVYSARSVIFSGPKFVAARVVKGLPSEQIDAIGQILYRPFLVANACLKKPAMPRTIYDAYALGLDGNTELGDLTLADWAVRETGPNSVVTCYIPIARDDGRADLIDDEKLPAQREQLIRDLLTVLGPRGLTREDIAEVRFARWGHPMVVPKPGQLSSGLFDRAAAPHGRVLFAHQDNYGNPCIESCFSAAQEASKRARALVPRRRRKGRG